MMMDGGLSDGPLITPVDAASTIALVGLLVGAIVIFCGILVSLWLCRRRWEHTKLSSDKSLAFRPPPRRKPTAVKSPGSTGHYLKKSPSPTGPAKSPPGSGAQASPSSNEATPQLGSPHQTSVPMQTGASTDVTLNIENERDKAEIEKSEKLADRGHLNGQLAKSDGLGQLVFKLRYLSDQNSLVVTVVKCKGLPARGSHKATSDPYVKLQLLPDKQHHAKTRVFRNTTDPVFDEDFTFFGITPLQFKKTSLHFIIMSFDRYSRDNVIGEVVYVLSSVSDSEIANNQQITLYQEIHPRSLKIQSQGRGELLVSLCWYPEHSKLIVVVLKARNLPKMDISGSADPYVKIYLMYNSQRISKRKTHVKKRTLNPIFNESLTFEIPNGTEGLSKVSLEFAMLDWDRVTKNETIGRLVIGGPDCQKDALNHWNEVCNSPKRQIADWYRLQE